jgi:Zn-finger nucleic acid-binding protein
MRHLGYLAFATALAWVCRKLMILSGTNSLDNFMWIFICYVNLFMFYLWIFSFGICAGFWLDGNELKKISELEKAHQDRWGELSKEIYKLEKENEILQREKDREKIEFDSVLRKIEEVKMKQTRSATEANQHALPSLL